MSINFLTSNAIVWIQANKENNLRPNYDDSNARNIISMQYLRFNKIKNRSPNDLIVALETELDKTLDNYETLLLTNEHTFFDAMVSTNFFMVK